MEPVLAQLALLALLAERAQLVVLVQEECFLEVHVLVPDVPDLAPVLVPGLAGERRVEGLVHVHPFLELAQVAQVGRVEGQVAGRVAGRLPAHCPRHLSA